MQPNQELARSTGPAEASRSYTTQGDRAVPVTGLQDTMRSARARVVSEVLTALAPPEPALASTA